MHKLLLRLLWEFISIRKELRIIMSATDDLKAGQAAIQKAVLDVVAALKNIAAGVSESDAETIASDLNAQAAALEAAIAPPPAV